MIKKYIRKKIRKYLHKLHGSLFKSGMHLLRQRVWHRDHHTCQLCHQRVHKTHVSRGERVVSNTGEVHHTRPKNTHPHLIHSVDNCVLLCHRCHNFIELMNSWKNPYYQLGWFPMWTSYEEWFNPCRSITSEILHDDYQCNNTILLVTNREAG